MRYYVLGGLLILLIPCTVTDLRDRTLPAVFMAAFGVTAAAVNRIFGILSWPELLAGLLPGVFLLAAARLSKERIGYGDGVLFLAIGLLCGAGGTVTILFLSLVLLAAAGTVILLARRKSMRTELPFAPFALASALITFAAGGL